MKKITVYVDGSFNPDLNRYSYGCICVDGDAVVNTLNGSGNDPEVAKIRNVAGEMLGAMNAVRWAKQQGYEAIDIIYDYMGIEMWATGGWKANNEYTRGYAEYMRKSSMEIAINFSKVAAHTGDKYNEQADELAKSALRQASQ